MARIKMKTKDLQRLLVERDKLVEQMEALRHRIGGLELAISVLEKDDDDEASKPQRGARGKTKELILSLLQEVGTTGLNATTAVELAKRRNMELARGTAASTLSRLKNDGVVLYEDDRYRLKEFPRPKVVGIQGVAATGVAGSLKASQG
jgi:hypothetical protein